MYGAPKQLLVEISFDTRVSLKTDTDEESLLGQFNCIQSEIEEKEEQEEER